jgi:hypothetical protein
LSSAKAFEDAVGLFHVALSFASDAGEDALTLRTFADFYQVRCYYYQDHVVSQSGLRIRDVMSHIYGSASTIVILNSPLYGKSKSTRFELRTIRAARAISRLVIVDLGGPPIQSLQGDVERYDELTDRAAIAIMSAVGRMTTVRARPNIHTCALPPGSPEDPTLRPAPRSLSRLV